MRIIAVLSVSLIMAACGKNASVPNGETEGPEVPNPTSMAADGAAPEGRYRAVSEDTGFVLIEDLRADGTYTFSGEDGSLVEEGDYDQKSPELVCFTPNTQGSVKKCYSDAIGEDGIWRTTDPDTGEVSVIERIDAE